MAMPMNTNLMSLAAQRHLSSTAKGLHSVMARLSSGLRVNTAKDDAAGLAIADRIQTKVKGLELAHRNANDGIGLAQTAEGALSRVTDMLQRARELAVQAANQTNSAGDRKALQAEVDQILAEVDRVAKQTSFNGQKVIDGSFSGAVFMVGANSGDNVTLGELVDARIKKMGRVQYATNTLTLDTRDLAGPPAQRAIEKYDTPIPAQTLKITVGTREPVELEAIPAANSSLERMGQVITAINNKTADTGVIAYLTNKPGTNWYDIAFMSGDVDLDGNPMKVQFDGFSRETTGLAPAQSLPMSMVADATNPVFKAVSAQVDGLKNLKTDLTAQVQDVIDSNPVLGALFADANAGKALQDALANLGEPTTKAQAQALKTALDALIAQVGTPVLQGAADYAAVISAISRATGSLDVGAGIREAVQKTLASNPQVAALAQQTGAGEPGEALKNALDALDSPTTRAKADAVKTALDALLEQGTMANKATVAWGAALTKLAQADGTNTGATKQDIEDTVNAFKAINPGVEAAASAATGTGRALNRTLANLSNPPTREQALAVRGALAAVVEAADRDNAAAPLKIQTSDAYKTAVATAEQGTVVTKESLENAVAVITGSGEPIKTLYAGTDGNDLRAKLAALSDPPKQAEAQEVQNALAALMGLARARALAAGTPAEQAKATAEHAVADTGGAWRTAQAANDESPAARTAELNALNAYGAKLADLINLNRKAALAAKLGVDVANVADSHPQLERQKYDFPATDFTTANLADARSEIARAESILGIRGIQMDNPTLAPQYKLDQIGIDDVSVTTQSSAWVAIKKLDSALDQVNLSRSMLGALQSRFEVTVTNIEVQSENLSASRSRIVDADFAVETSNLARLQILQQAGTTMIAQANQIPQQVLQLLKS